MIKLIFLLAACILASWVLWMGVKVIIKILKDISDTLNTLK